MKTVLLTIVALIAFASNSLLCRLALRPGLIDAASFTAIRLLSGALLLLLIVRRPAIARGKLHGPIALAAYAVPFSFAYLRLDASTGALILFAAVQLTMFGWSIARGQHPSRLEWIGLALAAAGVVWLNLPGLSAPDPLGASWMALAGVAWGAYSVLGRGVSDPTAATARNFVFAAPLGIAVASIIAALGRGHVTSSGAALAATSGAISSGLGYVVWYSALRGLSAAQAGVAQLAVPVIAAAGGIVLLDESVSSRLVGAGAVILTGVALALAARSRSH